MKYWSGLQPLTEENSCGVSQQDINSMMFSSQVIFASYSTLFYLLLLILSILGIFNKPCFKIFTPQSNFILFLIGALLVFVNIFAIENELEIRSYFRIATGFVIGIAFTIFGAFLFFTKADNLIITLLLSVQNLLAILIPQIVMVIKSTSLAQINGFSSIRPVQIKFSHF